MQYASWQGEREVVVGGGCGGWACQRGVAVQWRYRAVHPHACRHDAVEPDTHTAEKSVNVVICVCVNTA